MYVDKEMRSSRRRQTCIFCGNLIQLRFPVVIRCYEAQKQPAGTKSKPYSMSHFHPECRDASDAIRLRREKHPPGKGSLNEDGFTKAERKFICIKHPRAALRLIWFDEL